MLDHSTYFEFETEEALYRIYSRMHGAHLGVKDNKDLDAIVFETSNLGPSGFLGYLKIEDIFNPIKENVRIFSVDTQGPKHLGFGLEFLHGVGLSFGLRYGAKLLGASESTGFSAFFLGLILKGYLPMLAPFVKGKLGKLLLKISSGTHFVAQGPLTEFRTALSAYKISNGIIPLLQDEIQDRKPHIGIVYGASHAHVKDMLVHPLRQRIDLWLHKHYSRHLVSRRENLNQIYEYYLGDSIEITTREMPEAVRLYGC